MSVKPYLRAWRPVPSVERHDATISTSALLHLTRQCHISKEIVTYSAVVESAAVAGVAPLPEVSCVPLRAHLAERPACFDRPFGQAFRPSDRLDVVRPCLPVLPLRSRLAAYPSLRRLV